MPDVLLPDPTSAPDLVDARLALHLAAQVPAALGTTHLPDAGDFAHTNLGWHPRLRAVVGRPVEGLSAGLLVPDFTWVLVDAKGRVVSRQACAGLTLADGLVWLSEAVRERGGPHGAVALGTWELPADTAGDPLPSPDPGHLDQLARWFALADAALGRLRAAEPDATEPRVWPHHFDLAFLVPLGGEGDERSVGVGLSPGDALIAEPYVYVTPWPRPAAAALPDLRWGSWHTEGWAGAVLRGSEHGERPDTRLAAFLAEALPAARQLLS